MNKREEIYKCNACGNVVEFVHPAPGELTCCGEVMVLMNEQTADFKTEKHVPILAENIEGIKIKVGSTLHPMTEDHYIEWIEVINDDYINRKYLKPGDAPEAFFYVHNQKGLVIRSYCNKHGLWKA
jgi:superoxide reductase